MKTKQEIISNIKTKTLIFVVVVLFVSTFKSIFGAGNSTVGVSTIILILASIPRDLTKEPIKNLMYLISFNIILALGAFAFSQNLWLGLIANFLIMSSIGYLFTYELKKPLNMLVGLHYILMTSSPVSIQQLPMRLVAVISGACMIMAVQLLVNKNKLAKSSSKNILSIEEKLLLKINLIKENKNTDEVNNLINNSINQFKILIHESGKVNFKMTNCAIVSMNILSCLEKINILLDNINTKEIKEDVLNNIYIQFENIKNNKFDTSDAEKVLSIYKEDEDLVIINEFLSAFEILNNEIKSSKNIVDDSVSDVDVHKSFKDTHMHKKNIKKISYRVAYGIRLGTLVALTGFISQLFELEYGKWMMFTVLALTQPYAQYSYIRSKKRVLGTVIGALIVFVTFNLVKDPTIRMVILLFAGYLNAYTTDYRDIVILTTISAVCVDAINIPSPNFIIMNRLVFVGIGIVLSVIANKFILPRDYKDEEVGLIDMQNQLSNTILKEVLLSKNKNENNIRTLFLVEALIESRVDILNLKIEKDFLNKNKILINDIYQIHLIGNKNYKHIMEDVENIVVDNDDINIIRLEISNYIQSKDDLREKAFLMSILIVLKDVCIANEQANELENLVLAM